MIVLSNLEIRVEYHERKEAVMKKQVALKWAIIPLLFFLYFPFATGEAAKKVELVGRETLNFTLPSTHDRIITYADEYYGKHHLIITFFPAAYTPI